MSKPITVKDIRQAIRNLPDTAFVLFNDRTLTNFTDRNSHTKEIEGCAVMPVHDGRYGPSLSMEIGKPWHGDSGVLLFTIGNMAARWGNQSYQDFQHDTAPGYEPDPDTPAAVDIPDDSELDALIEARFEKETTNA